MHFFFKCGVYKGPGSNRALKARRKSRSERKGTRTRHWNIQNMGHPTENPKEKAQSRSKGQRRESRYRKATREADLN